MSILITGGLGYIGSHIARLLKKKSVIIDNQSNSLLNFKQYLPDATVYLSDLNKANLEKVFKKHDIKGVIHLAGLKASNESVSNPLKYYENNIGSSMVLLKAMDKFKINKLIFSSSATVYGDQHSSPLREDMTLQSVNPYGSTKIIIEQLISDYAKSNSRFCALSLRYFNPLGADVKTGLVDQPLGEPQNLMPILVRSAHKKKIIKIYGSDYPTPDGTCIRDYIHVKDLSAAHVLAFKRLHQFKGHRAINLGLGKGASVLEIIRLFEKVNGIKARYQIAARRKGDAAISFASNQLAKKLLGWRPLFNYENMVRDAWSSYINQTYK